MLLATTQHLGPVQHHATTVAIATAAAIAGSITTACLLYSCSPAALLGKAKRWWGGQQVAAYEADEGQPWPAEGFRGPPRCRPISMVSELLTWQPPAQPSDKSAAVDNKASDSCSAHNQVVDPCSSTTPLHPVPSSCSFPASSWPQQQRPQLLVCHDMQGGYLPEEIALTGAAGAGHYRLWHWDCIDVFVYFSHHMVTIPPKGWIHAAHMHGTKVLGTFITEFGQGRQRCNRLFSCHQSAEAVADQLAAMALHYGFEGWLVNIENPLTKEQVAVMQHFVGYLRARMRTLCHHGLVIWYDAVTIDGELRWQNKLSAANAPFFDLSDGLFLNYCWTPDTLPESVRAAGQRTSDVYVGVDVHGRGCYGGGGHNTGLALAAACAAGLSAALFAPGWVYENLDRSRFAELQEHWWLQVQASWQHSHAVVHSLPFSTNFNTGAGLAWFEGGKLLSPAAAQPAAAAVDAPAAAAAASVPADGGWFNMLLTEVLPTCRDPISQQVVTGPVVARLTASTAYSGGACLVLCTQQQAQAQQQQQQQQSSKQATAAAAAVAVTAQAPCCTLQLHEDSAASETASSTDHRQLALLQLYRTAVAVSEGCKLQVKCVYAAPSSSSSGTSQPSVPLVWIATEPRKTAAAAAAASGRQEPADRVIHLPVGVLSQQQTGPQQQPHPLLLSDGQPSGVALQVQLHDQGIHASKRLGPVQCVKVLTNSISSVATTVPEAAAAAAAAAVFGADTMWTADLTSKLSGWYWFESSAQVLVPAGRVITGIGVAVQDNSSSSSSPSGNSTGSSCKVLGLIGQLGLATL